MLKRLISALILFGLFISMIPMTYAADFTDMQDHWAAGYVEHVVSQGLFNGVSEDLFSPNTTMTRGMFVTVLGRLEGIDVEHWSSDAMIHLFEDVPDNTYYTPYVRWAFCKGIVNGMDAKTFAPDAPITREQMAKLAAYYIEKMGHSFEPILAENELPPVVLTSFIHETPAKRDLPEIEEIVFADEEYISSWAKDSVHTLCEVGILTGVANADGTLSFLPQNTATRAECATVFSRILNTIYKNPMPEEDNVTVSLDVFELHLQVGEMYPLSANTSVEGAPLTWLTSDPEILEVDEHGLITCNNPGTAIVTVYTTGGYYNTCYVYCESRPEPEYPLENMSHADKCMMIVGEVVGDPRYYYTGHKAAAESNLTYIEIRTWDISKKSGEKYTRTWTLRVHYALADAIVAAFEEIYNGPEQFPIHDVYCYNWGSGTSEHSLGTAIDINWNENYHCMPDGTPLTGSYWKPGEDPYSIPEGGDVVTAFAHQGFRWGIYWNSGKKDYMHFSFFGT